MILLTTPPPDINSQYSELTEEKIQLEKRIKEIQKEQTNLLKPYTVDAYIDKLDQISKEWNTATNMLMRELFKKATIE
jgi:hypothetical protein